MLLSILYVRCVLRFFICFWGGIGLLTFSIAHASLHMKKLTGYLEQEEKKHPFFDLSSSDQIKLGSYRVFEEGIATKLKNYYGSIPGGQMDRDLIPLNGKSPFRKKDWMNGLFDPVDEFLPHNPRKHRSICIKTQKGVGATTYLYQLLGLWGKGLLWQELEGMLRIDMEKIGSQDNHSFSTSHPLLIETQIALGVDVPGFQATDFSAFFSLSRKLIVLDHATLLLDDAHAYNFVIQWLRNFITKKNGVLLFVVDQKMILPEELPYLSDLTFALHGLSSHGQSIYIKEKLQGWLSEREIKKLLRLSKEHPVWKKCLPYYPYIEFFVSLAKKWLKKEQETFRQQEEYKKYHSPLSGISLWLEGSDKVKTIDDIKHLPLTGIVNGLVKHLLTRYYFGTKGEKISWEDTLHVYSHLLHYLAKSAFLMEQYKTAYLSVYIQEEAKKWLKKQYSLVPDHWEDAITIFIKNYLNHPDRAYFRFPYFRIFFAAWFIVHHLDENTSKEEKEKIFQFQQKNKLDPYYRLLFSFVTGLLYIKCKEGKDPNGKILMDWYTKLQSLPRDITNVHYCALMLSCLQEACADTSSFYLPSKVKKYHQELLQEAFSPIFFYLESPLKKTSFLQDKALEQLYLSVMQEARHIVRHKLWEKQLEGMISLLKKRIPKSRKETSQKKKKQKKIDQQEEQYAAALCARGFLNKWKWISSLPLSGELAGAIVLFLLDHFLVKEKRKTPKEEIFPTYTTFTLQEVQHMMQDLTLYCEGRQSFDLLGNTDVLVWCKKILPVAVNQRNVAKRYYAELLSAWKQNFAQRENRPRRSRCILMLLADLLLVSPEVIQLPKDISFFEQLLLTSTSLDEEKWLKIIFCAIIIRNDPFVEAYLNKLNMPNQIKQPKVTLQVLLPMVLYVSDKKRRLEILGRLTESAIELLQYDDSGENNVWNMLLYGMRQLLLTLKEPSIKKQVMIKCFNIIRAFPSTRKKQLHQWLALLKQVSAYDIESAQYILDALKTQYVAMHEGLLIESIALIENLFWYHKKKKEYIENALKLPQIEKNTSSTSSLEMGVLPTLLLGSSNPWIVVRVITCIGNLFQCFTPQDDFLRKVALSVLDRAKKQTKVATSEVTYTLKLAKTLLIASSDAHEPDLSLLNELSSSRAYKLTQKEKEIEIENFALKQVEAYSQAFCSEATSWQKDELKKYLNHHEGIKKNKELQQFINGNQAILSNEKKKKQDPLSLNKNFLTLYKDQLMPFVKEYIYSLIEIKEHKSFILDRAKKKKKMALIRHVAQALYMQLEVGRFSKSLHSWARKYIEGRLNSLREKGYKVKEYPEVYLSLLQTLTQLLLTAKDQRSCPPEKINTLLYKAYLIIIELFKLDILTYSIAACHHLGNMLHVITINSDEKITNGKDPFEERENTFFRWCIEKLQSNIKLQLKRQLWQVLENHLVVRSKSIKLVEPLLDAKEQCTKAYFAQMLLALLQRNFDSLYLQRVEDFHVKNEQQKKKKVIPIENLSWITIKRLITKLAEEIHPITLESVLSLLLFLTSKKEMAYTQELSWLKHTWEATQKRWKKINGNDIEELESSEKNNESKESASSEPPNEVDSSESFDIVLKEPAPLPLIDDIKEEDEEDEVFHSMVQQSSPLPTSLQQRIWSSYSLRIAAHFMLLLDKIDEDTYTKEEEDQWLYIARKDINKGKKIFKTLVQKNKRLFFDLAESFLRKHAPKELIHYAIELTSELLKKSEEVALASGCDLFLLGLEKEVPYLVAQRFPKQRQRLKEKEIQVLVRDKVSQEIERVLKVISKENDMEKEGEIFRGMVSLYGPQPYQYYLKQKLEKSILEKENRIEKEMEDILDLFWKNYLPIVFGLEEQKEWKHYGLLREYMIQQAKKWGTSMAPFQEKQEKAKELLFSCEVLPSPKFLSDTTSLPSKRSLSVKSMSSVSSLRGENMKERIKKINKMLAYIGQETFKNKQNKGYASPPRVKKNTQGDYLVFLDFTGMSKSLRDMLLILVDPNQPYMALLKKIEEKNNGLKLTLNFTPEKKKNLSLHDLLLSQKDSFSQNDHMSFQQENNLPSKVIELEEKTDDEE